MSAESNCVNNIVSQQLMPDRQASTNTSFTTQPADCQQSNSDHSISTSVTPPVIPVVTNNLFIPPMTINGTVLPNIASLAVNPPPPPAAFALDAPKMDVAAPSFTPTPTPSSAPSTAPNTTLPSTTGTPSGVQGFNASVNPLDTINMLRQQQQQSLAKLQLYALQLNTLQILNQQNSTPQSVANYQAVWSQYQLELNRSVMINQTIESLVSVFHLTPTGNISISPISPIAPSIAITPNGMQCPPQQLSVQTPVGPELAECAPKETPMSSKSVGKLATIAEGEDEEMNDHISDQDPTPDLGDDAAQIAGICTNYTKGSDHEGDSDGIEISPRCGSDHDKQSMSPPVPSMTGKHGEKLEVSEMDNLKFPEIKNTSSSTTNAVGERNHDKNGDLEHIKRQIRGILNKITPENFDKLSLDISSMLKVADLALEGIDDMEQRSVASRVQFKSMIKLILRCILEKAIHEPLFSNLFARLCYSLYLHAERTTLNQMKQKIFRQQLLSLCHSVFKRARSAALADSTASKQFIGIITMIGELFTYGLVSWNVISSGIFNELLPPQSAVDIEAVCKLLKVSGHNFDRDGHREDINLVLSSLPEYAQHFGFRTQCLVQEICEMRSNDWKQKIQRDSPQRLEQIHHQFYAEHNNNHHHHHQNNNNGGYHNQFAGNGNIRPQRTNNNNNNNRWRSHPQNGWPAPRHQINGHGHGQQYHGQQAQYQQRRGSNGYHHNSNRNQSGYNSYSNRSGHNYRGNGGHHYQRRKGPSNRPSVEFVKDVTLPDRSHYPSNKVLTKTWAMKNSGEMPWGDDVELVYFKGDESLCLDTRYPVISAVPGQVVEMSATVRTPSEPGRYCTYFRLMKNGKFFGPRVWVDIIVSGPDSPRSMDGVMNCSTKKESYKNAVKITN